MKTKLHTPKRARKHPHEMGEIEARFGHIATLDRFVMVSNPVESPSQGAHTLTEVVKKARRHPRFAEKQKI